MPNRAASRIALNPGTYWYVQDYMERGTDDGAFAGLGANTDESISATREEYIEKYGEDNAKYLWQQLGDMTRNYAGLAYIEMGIEPDGRFVWYAAGAGDWQYNAVLPRYQLHRRGWRGDGDCRHSCASASSALASARGSR